MRFTAVEILDEALVHLSYEGKTLQSFLHPHYCCDFLYFPVSELRSSTDYIYDSGIEYRISTVFFFVFCYRFI
jgi:hypothetical protein